MASSMVVRFALVLLACGGCDVVIGIGELNAPADPPPVPYDRCAPGGYNDPLRYKFLATGTVDSTVWNQARAACLRYGMDLAVFNDEHEQAFADIELWPYWIGLSQAADGAWTTVDGCMTPQMPAAGSLAASPQCGAIFGGVLSPQGTSCDGSLVPITDGDPTAMAGVLCETPRPADRSCLPSDPATETYTASPGPLDHDAATAFCAARGEHLLVIDSWPELEAVAQLARDQSLADVWIGTRYDGTTWHADTGCPADHPWAGLGPELDTGSTCAATVQMADPNDGSVSLQGIAVTACTEPRIALCEDERGANPL